MLHFFFTRNMGFCFSYIYELTMDDMATRPGSGVCFLNKKGFKSFFQIGFLSSEVEGSAYGLLILYVHSVGASQIEA